MLRSRGPVQSQGYNLGVQMEMLPLGHTVLPLAPSNAQQWVMEALDQYSQSPSHASTGIGSNSPSPDFLQPKHTSDAAQMHLGCCLAPC